MKKGKLFVGLLGMFLLVANIGRAQEQNEASNSFDKFYITLGATNIANLKVNNFLRNQGLPAVPKWGLGFGVGFIFNVQPVLMTVEVNGAYSSSHTHQVRNQFGMADVDLNVQYPVFKVHNIPFYFGGKVGFQMATMSLNRRHQTISFGDLNPSHNPAIMTMTNWGGILGPTFATGDLFPKHKIDLRAKASYTFTPIAGRWKSDYADVSGSPKEYVRVLNFGLMLAF